MAKLFIICGHGDGDPGACSGGYSEAERVRALAKRIKELGGDSVKIGDTSIDWYASNEISKRTIPSGYQVVELHMDSASASARGGHVVIYSGYGADEYDKALAMNISKLFPGRARTIVPRNDLANPYRAAIAGYSYRLLECCFISNPDDLSKFNNKMDEVAKNILSAFGIGAQSVSYNADGWIKDNIGWWYRHKDGSYKKNDWEKIGNDWYWFDGSGYAVHDQWISYKGNWYYFKSDCRMATGWQKLSDGWYYLLTKDSAGKPYGAMLTGWQNIGGHTYYFAPKTEKDRVNGRMVTGWVYDKGAWYWCNKSLNCQPEGSLMINHWITDGGKRYYLKDDGKTAANETLTIGGQKYSFDSSGACK